MWAGVALDWSIIIGFVGERFRACLVFPICVLVGVIVGRAWWPVGSALGQSRCTSQSNADIRWLTTETCYTTSDAVDSPELCSYTGPVCWSSSGVAFVSVLDDKAANIGPRLGPVLHPMRWATIRDATSASDMLWLSKELATAAESTPPLLTNPGSTSVSRVTWHTGTALLFDASRAVPSSTVLSALWSARRRNATEARFEFGERLPGRSFVLREGAHVWRSVDYAVSLGEHKRAAWASRVGIDPILRLAAGEGIRVLTPSVAQQPTDGGELECVAHALAGSDTMATFTTVVDAASFRQAAYAAANVTTAAVPEYAPRHIGVYDSSSNSKLLAYVERTVAQTGIPWSRVFDDISASCTSSGSDAASTWETAQWEPLKRSCAEVLWLRTVTTFAGVGVLVIVGGEGPRQQWPGVSAGLSSTVYMPTTSAVIQISSPRKPTAAKSSAFLELTRVSGIRYYSIVTEDDNDAASLRLLHVHLAAALDDIGCRDAVCAEHVGGPYHTPVR